MRLRALDPGTVRPGDRILAFARPENIEVLANHHHPGSENVVRGRVDQIVFEGPTVRLVVDVGGTPIRVTAGGLERLTLLDKGEREVTLRLQEVSVVPDEAASAS